MLTIVRILWVCYSFVYFNAGLCSVGGSPGVPEMTSSVWSINKPVLWHQPHPCGGLLPVAPLKRHLDCTHGRPVTVVPTTYVHLFCASSDIQEVGPHEQQTPSISLVGPTVGQFFSIKHKDVEQNGRVKVIDCNYSIY